MLPVGALGSVYSKNRLLIWGLMFGAAAKQRKIESVGAARRLNNFTNLKDIFRRVRLRVFFVFCQIGKHRNLLGH